MADATVIAGGPTVTLALTLTLIRWQTPQYMLVGMGEIFAAITCYELFYAEVTPITQT